MRGWQNYDKSEKRRITLVVWALAAMLDYDPVVHCFQLGGPNA